MISFAEKHPEMVCEWSDRNALRPDQVSYGSNKMIIWSGKCGHTWTANVKNRGNGHGCPYCSGNTVLVGFNDLASKRPKLVKEWSSVNEIQPSQVTARSTRYAYWKCSKCGHEWYARIADRSAGSGCPVCAGQKTVSGINDLKTLYPALFSELSDKNENTGSAISIKSRENLWWKCSKCGHEWQAVVYTRVCGSGCLKCLEAERKIRAEEKRQRLIREYPDYQFKLMALAFYAKRVFPDVLFNSDEIIGVKTKIYLPEKKAVIEFDEKKLRGKKYRWENAKNWLCLKSGIKLFRIVRPGGTQFENCVCIVLNDESAGVFDVAIRVIFEMLGDDADVDIKRDYELINKEEESTDEC